MLKRVDVATRLGFEQARAGTWRAGVNVLGLEQEGVGLAFDDNNAALVTPEMRARIDQARAEVVAGRVRVHDFMTDNSCPVQ
jgi:basic membrane protein A